MNPKLYVVTDEDNLYYQCVGELVAETSLHTHINIGNEIVIFEKYEVKRIT